MGDRLDGLGVAADSVQSYHPAPTKRPSQKSAVEPSPLSFYEFFAGGGMARAGLGKTWTCLFANDFDFKKGVTYTDNWGEAALTTKDVGKVGLDELPGRAALAWASFPCQDLSLAGMGAGLKGDRSGTFWPFWALMKQLKEEGRNPPLVVLENVIGTLTSHKGKDFSAIADALSATGYQFGAVIIDAVEFVPQSRPRLFIIAAESSIAIPSSLKEAAPVVLRHTSALKVAYTGLSAEAKNHWVWWKVPAAPKLETRFADLVEENPESVQWHTGEETKKLLAMMSPLNRKKLAAVKKSGKTVVGTIYKRTRLDENDEKVQRAEVRFDNIAGCLRTSSGGSSRQLILVVKGNIVRSRLMSNREAARLMGLDDDYKLPKNYNEAYHLTGDGVCVPVVRHLASTLLEPILEARALQTKN